MKKLLLIVLAALMAVSCDLLFNRDSDSTPPRNDIAISAIKTTPAATIGEIIDLDVMVKNPGSLDVKEEIEITLLDRTQGVMIGSQTLEDGLARNDSVMLRYRWDTGESSAGDHTIVATHNLSDDNTANDSLASVLTMIDPDITDLAIVGINIPEMVHQYETVDVEVTVKNVGNQDIHEALEVLLKGKTLAEDIGILTISEGLASGDSTLLVFSWNTEGASPGVHEIEAFHKFADENSANNLLVQEVTVTEALFVDIAVTALTAPASATEGDVITISATVRNVGTLSAEEDFEVILFDETDNQQLASQTINGGLALDNTVVVSFSWDTEGAGIGSHDLTVSHTFDDENTANDSLTAQITIVGAPFTDIFVARISGPSSVIVGNKVNISVTVENQGNQDVDDDIEIMLYDQSDDTVVDTKDIKDGLTAGTSTTITLSWDTDKSTLGKHTLVASHNFDDDDTNNDSRSTTITVIESALIDLAVVDMSGPLSAIQGDNVSVSVTVQNLGNRDIEETITLTLTDETDDINIATATLRGGILEGETETVTFKWETEEASFGSHRLVVIHDLDDDKDDNNSQSIAIIIDEPIFVDIGITKVDAKKNVEQGDDLKVKVELKNLGSRDVSNAITVKLTDQTDGKEIGVFVFTGGMRIGSSVSIEFKWDTEDASIGNHTLVVQHDFEDDNIKNNSGSKVVKVEED